MTKQTNSEYNLENISVNSITTRTHDELKNVLTITEQLTYNPSLIKRVSEGEQIVFINSPYLSGSFFGISYISYPYKGENK